MSDEVKQKAKTVATATIDTIASAAGFPIIQPFLAISDFVSKIREESYIKKLRFFFEHAEKVSDEDKEKFLVSLAEKRDDFLKKLFIAIEQLDEDEKAEIIGRLFKALVLGKMDATKFNRLCLVVKNIFLPDLEHFQSKYSFDLEKVSSFISYNEDDNHITSSLIANGLIYEKDGGGVMNKIIPTHYYGITTLGQLMLEYGLKKE